MPNIINLGEPLQEGNTKTRVEFYPPQSSDIGELGEHWLIPNIIFSNQFATNYKDSEWAPIGTDTKFINIDGKITLSSQSNNSSSVLTISFPNVTFINSHIYGIIFNYSIEGLENDSINVISSHFGNKLINGAEATSGVWSSLYECKQEETTSLQLSFDAEQPSVQDKIKVTLSDFILIDITESVSSYKNFKANLTDEIWNKISQDNKYFETKLYKYSNREYICMETTSNYSIWNLLGKEPVNSLYRTLNDRPGKIDDENWELLGQETQVSISSLSPMCKLGTIPFGINIPMSQIEGSIESIYRLTNGEYIIITKKSSTPSYVINLYRIDLNKKLKQIGNSLTLGTKEYYTIEINDFSIGTFLFVTASAYFDRQAWRLNTDTYETLIMPNITQMAGYSAQSSLFVTPDDKLGFISITIDNSGYNATAGINAYVLNNNTFQQNVTNSLSNQASWQFYKNRTDFGIISTQSYSYYSLESDILNRRYVAPVYGSDNYLAKILSELQTKRFCLQQIDTGSVPNKVTKCKVFWLYNDNIIRSEADQSETGTFAQIIPSEVLNWPYKVKNALVFANADLTRFWSWDTKSYVTYDKRPEIEYGYADYKNYSQPFNTIAISENYNTEPSTLAENYSYAFQWTYDNNTKKINITLFNKILMDNSYVLSYYNDYSLTQMYNHHSATGNFFTNIKVPQVKYFYRSGPIEYLTTSDAIIVPDWNNSDDMVTIMSTDFEDLNTGTWWMKVRDN